MIHFWEHYRTQRTIIISVVIIIIVIIIVNSVIFIDFKYNIFIFMVHLTMLSVAQVIKR
jgi:hypothetical protein